MDTRLNHRAALVRTAELHREAAVHRLAQHATRRQKLAQRPWAPPHSHRNPGSGCRRAAGHTEAKLITRQPSSCRAVPST